MRSRRTIGVALILLFGSVFSIAQPVPEPVAANGSVFGAFRVAYPDSTSPAASCQLCHMKSSGGDGWNAYGWSIRQEIEDNNLDVAAAIAAVEALDSDGNGVSNLDEINAGRLPGWTKGAVNTIFMKDGSTLANQEPPNRGVPLDISVQITNPFTAPITSDNGLSVGLRTVADGLLSPVLGTSTPSLPDYLFVIDQPGQIYQIDLNTGAKSVFADLSSRVIPLGLPDFGNYDERGLLGLAFHPDYATNGLLYTYQSEAVQGTPTFTTTMPLTETADHQGVVTEWSVNDPTNPASVVDAATVRELMRIDQPQFNHNGGQLAFGPDKMLYLGLGDGGSSDDGPLNGHGEFGNGRDATNPLGSILRIDPQGTDSINGQYGIPDDNPFVAADDDRLDEIFAYGFRNPYRFAFDRDTGDLIAADVGQNEVEEIDVVVSGGNYGWNYKEGSFFFDPNGNARGFIAEDPGGLPTDLIDPIAEYDRSEGHSVTGGFVYRGAEIPALNGTYVFGDWSSEFFVPLGRLFHLDVDNNIREFQLTNRDKYGMLLTGFGEDARGELYALGNLTGIPSGDKTGAVMKIVAPTTLSEKVMGDFSGDRAAPEQFTLAEGENEITATSVKDDLEYYSITIPEGMTLDSIVLESYESITNTQSFIAIQSGPTFTEPSTPADITRANLLGYLLFGIQGGYVGTNILDDMGTAEDASGFTGALPSGTYTVWSQETSTNAATYSLNFNVSMLAPTALPTIVEPTNMLYLPTLIN